MQADQVVFLARFDDSFDVYCVFGAFLARRVDGLPREESPVLYLREFQECGAAIPEDAAGR